MLKLAIEKKRLIDASADYYLVPVYKGAGASQFSESIYGRAAGQLKSLYKQGEIRDKYLKKSILSVPAGNSVKKMIFTGMGEEKGLNNEKIRQAAGFAVREARSLGAKKLAAAAWSKDAGKFRAQLEGLYLACYEYSGFKKEEPSMEIISVCGGDAKIINESRTVLANVFSLRDMMSSPSNLVTPSYIEKKAREYARQAGRIRVKAFGLKEAKKLGMGAFCAVAQGSEEPALFIIMEYRGGKKGGKPVVFVGKGITFDTGGISLKPQSSALSKIEDMRYDMSGAAVVMHLIKTVSELRLPVNMACVMPCTENMPSGKAYKPGDVLKSMNGKTIEVISTDAEGRLILADAITYAIKKYKPAWLVDIATLTGACVIALGHYATGLMGNSEKLIEIMKKAGDQTGERVWQLPLYDEYKDQIKSKFADIKNTGGGDAGTITAGLFLKEFADPVPWVHLDIAGTAYGVRGRHYIPDGTAGTGLRLMLSFLKKTINGGNKNV
jgi:leucyl aminopeptidase